MLLLCFDSVNAVLFSYKKYLESVCARSRLRFEQVLGIVVESGIGDA